LGKPNEAVDIRGFCTTTITATDIDVTPPDQ
jgi:hypothetical protein